MHCGPQKPLGPQILRGCLCAPALPGFRSSTQTPLPAGHPPAPTSALGPRPLPVPPILCLGDPSTRALCSGPESAISTPVHCDPLPMPFPPASPPPRSSPTRGEGPLGHRGDASTSSVTVWETDTSHLATSEPAQWPPLCSCLLPGPAPGPWHVPPSAWKPIPTAQLTASPPSGVHSHFTSLEAFETLAWNLRALSAHFPPRCWAGAPQIHTMGSRGLSSASFVQLDPRCPCTMPGVWGHPVRPRH